MHTWLHSGYVMKNGNKKMLDSTTTEAFSAANIGPALVGTAAYMLMTDGTWKKRLAQGVVGVPLSIYLAPSVGAWFERTGHPILPEAAGALTAVFGIAAISYVFEVWKHLHVGPLLRQWIIKRLGVEDKQNDAN